MGRTGQGEIRVGIGGWSYPPWRRTFFPEGLPQARELEYASRQMTSIEINATFYRAQKPASFAKWRDETPDDFVFAVKAPRYATIRKALGEAGPAIDQFFGGGVTELQGKLGPVLWQFAPTKRFAAEEVEAFLALLPREVGGRPVQHVLEPRHSSWLEARFVELARRYRCAIVFTDSAEHPVFADVTADFVYARLVRAEASLASGYPAATLAAWAKIARTFARGSEPSEFPRLLPAAGRDGPRAVYVFFINGAKERAPAAAAGLLAALREK